MAINTMDPQKLDPNNFTGPTREISGPVRIGAVTPGTPYGEFARWLYVGATGNVSFICWDGTTQVMVAPALGIWHRLHTIGINTSGTTATSMLWGS